MDFNIVHAINGRIRVRLNPDTLKLYRHGYIARALADVPGITGIKINPISGSVLVHYEPAQLTQEMVLLLLRTLQLSEFPLDKRENQGVSLGWLYMGYLLYRFMQPVGLKPYFTIFGAIPYVMKGLRSLSRGKMDIDLLDASALSASLLQRNFRSASTLTLLLKTGEYLEQWAKHRSRVSLEESIANVSGMVWIKEGDAEKQIPYSQVKADDTVVIRAGAMIPVDGKVIDGEAMVNESSLTGEPLPVMRAAGHTVHAGTVLEEGELYVCVLQKGEDTRFRQIIHMIEESEASKAEIETKANAMADKVVPFNFLLAGSVFAITRNPVKATTALSVDYSCALKLSTPLVFLAAMKEGLNHGVFFKGGATMEMLSRVDTIVFDKTGTLTKAQPSVAKVIGYNGYDAREVLKIAACLEEHFPHPVAKAVVKHAVDENVEHLLEHAEVKYIVAHGIATLYQDKHTVIGSRHFICDDEKVDIAIAAADEEQAAAQGYSILYLARDNVLAGILYIYDPAREEAAEVISMLRHTGIKYIYMVTGDNQRTAKKIADELGITGFMAETLPNQKAEAVKVLQSKGRCVAVVGDGMNDSPALSVADVGIAMKGGADLAQHVADITLNDASLYPLVIARILSQRAMRRISYNNMSAISINTLLMGFGIVGALTGTSSMWLHNLTTLGISANSMRALLPKADDKP